MESFVSTEESFPEDRTGLDITEFEVLNRRIHRALDTEHANFGTSDPEAESGSESRTGGLDSRDAATVAVAIKAMHAMKTR